MPIVQANSVTIGGRAILYEVHGNAVIFQFGDRSYTEEERAMIRDHLSNTVAFKLPDINKLMRKHSLIQSIINLPRAEAVFNDYQNKKKSGPCFKGTREALLRAMADWTTGSSEARMYVLSGLAGIGKSTVAYTVAARTAELGLLGASFFFSRDEADRSHAKKFFTTIAYQLCVYDETFANAIGDALLTESGSAAITKDPQEQLRTLIVDPLRDIIQSRTRPILVVVDGLDECNEDDEHDVFIGLSQLVQLLPSFRVILTTRPQPLVNYIFSNHDGHKIFYLQDIEDKIVDSDIRLYLSYNFSQEQVRARLQNTNEQWYASGEEIEYLVKASGRLFIVASTAVLYVLNKSLGNPRARMKRLLGEISQDRTPFHALNHFYSIIIRSAIQVDDNDDDIMNCYQLVVGTVVTMQTPLPVATFACLIGEETAKIYAILRNLQSVILLDSDDAPRIYHKSFSDYIIDPARCKDPHLRINAKIHHKQFAMRCFKTMNKHLKYNILDLGDPARFMRNEDGIRLAGITDEQLREKIPQQLRYACVYWANHVEGGNMEVDVTNELEKVANEHLLHWLEVLSLIGKLDSAHRAIRISLKQMSTSSGLYQLFSDVLRFISKFYQIIERSALHTYYSALPFAPTNSLLYRRYIKEAVDNVCDISGGPKEWDSLIASLGHGGPTEFIKFSLDSTLFVSWNSEARGYSSNQGMLKIWDMVTTGAPTYTIPGHKFAIANDFTMIASSETNTINIYDVNKSIPKVIIKAPSNIRELAFSMENSRVAAFLSDGNVWLWDSRKAEIINNFYGLGERAQLQFSPTGTRLAYRSMNGIIKLHDGTSGKFIADLPVDPWNYFRFVFSGDGSRIASLIYDFGLKLWSTGSGALIGAVEDVGVGDEDTKLAISANGSLLAVSERRTRGRVKLWSANRGGPLSLVVVLEEHAHLIAFSRGNILAIAINGGIVKLYHTETQSFISTLLFTSWAVQMAFSPDCTHLAVASVEGIIYLWDIQVRLGIDGHYPPSKEHTIRSRVATWALSRKCSRLAFGFEDGTVELWETSPTLYRRIATHRAHTGRVWTLEFDPDGSMLVSGSDDETVKLWHGKGKPLCGTVKAHGKRLVVAVSKSMVAVAWNQGVTLWTIPPQEKKEIEFWTLSTLIHAHTFEHSLSFVESLAISDDSKLAAVAFRAIRVTLFDIVNRLNFVTIDLPEYIRTITFLPDNSQLMVQGTFSGFHFLNIVNKQIVKGPILEHLVQLPNMLLWCGVPIWQCQSYGGHYYLAALFPQHANPVPVLWIPKDLLVEKVYQGSSMIVIHCKDQRVIFVRPSTNRVR